MAMHANATSPLTGRLYRHSYTFKRQNSGPFATRKGQSCLKDDLTVLSSLARVRLLRFAVNCKRCTIHRASSSRARLGTRFAEGKPLSLRQLAARASA